MFTRKPTSNFTRSVLWRQNKFHRICFFGAAIGTLGITLLAQAPIYGDTAVEETDNKKQDLPEPLAHGNLTVVYPTSFTVPPYSDGPNTERVLHRASSCTTHGDTGIKRIDVISFPKSV